MSNVTPSYNEIHIYSVYNMCGFEVNKNVPFLTILHRS